MIHHFFGNNPTPNIIKSSKWLPITHEGEIHQRGNFPFKTQVQNGKLNLTWLEKGELKHVMGVIPVMDGVTYDSVYQNYQEGKWIPIENPAAPVVHYSSFGKPLTKEQLNKLSMPMGKK